MCGIIAVLLADPSAAVNQEIYDGLTSLQHRGQDAAGECCAVLETREWEGARGKGGLGGVADLGRARAGRGFEGFVGGWTHYLSKYIPLQYVSRSNQAS
jgi:glutamine phosphoribosylpyrophosphate amidotransferase